MEAPCLTPLALGFRDRVHPPGTSLLDQTTGWVLVWSPESRASRVRLRGVARRPGLHAGLLRNGGGVLPRTSWRGGDLCVPECDSSYTLVKFIPRVYFNSCKFNKGSQRRALS